LLPSNFPTVFLEKVINNAQKKLLIRYESTACKNILFRKLLKYNLFVSFVRDFFNKEPKRPF